MASRRSVSPRARAATLRKPREATGSQPSLASREDPRGYWALSARPLHILAFLTPLVVLYELGSAVYLVSDRAGTQRTIQAQRLLGDFFQVFGVVGLFLPGVALLTVLLVWHILLRDRWRVELPVVAGMLLEAAAWTLPLLVLAGIHSRATAGRMMPAASAAGDLTLLPWQARLTISIGAGLYEEMLFRLVLIAVLHLVLADVARLRTSLAYPLCAIGSGVAFAMYHDTSLAAGAGTDWPKFLFYAASGVYLGSVYMLRGFGIVVGAHALFDVIALRVLVTGP